MNTFIKFPLPAGKEIFVALAHIVAVRPHHTNSARCFLVLSNDPDDWFEIRMDVESAMVHIKKCIADNATAVWGI